MDIAQKVREVKSSGKECCLLVADYNLDDKSYTRDQINQLSREFQRISEKYNGSITQFKIVEEERGDDFIVLCKSVFLMENEEVYIKLCTTGIEEESDFLLILGKEGASSLHYNDVQHLMPDCYGKRGPLLDDSYFLDDDDDDDDELEIPF